MQEYKQKRDFTRTTEPSPAKKPGQGPLTFVIQKHRARQLHYDFRLELDGVLKSWSVPKGPSLNPQEKRLAVMVEDHPLDYASFEGQIPKGEYGAGEVIVWDRGTYAPEEEGTALFDDREKAEQLVRRGLEEGKLSLVLRGEKLKGSSAFGNDISKTPHWRNRLRHRRGNQVCSNRYNSMRMPRGNSGSVRL